MAQPYALQSAPYNQNNSSYKRECQLLVVLVSNGSVVSIDVAKSAPGFTVATAAAGVINGTMPKASRGVAFIQGKAASASNDLLANFSAFDPKAGTFSIQNHNTSAETILASGDELWILFILEGG